MMAVQEKASRVAARANIVDVRLFKTSAELSGIPNSDNRLAWSLHVKPAADYSEGDSYSIIHVDYEIQIEEVRASADPAEDESDGHELATISFQFGALYELDTEGLESPIEPDEVLAYARSGAMDTLFPYAREYVHDVTMRLGLPPLMMSIRYAAFASSSHKKDEHESVPNS